MHLRTYILLIALFCLIGLCTVRESARQTAVRYRMAELLDEEKRLIETQAGMEERLAALTEPQRLETLGRELGLELRPLVPLPEGSLEIQAARRDF